jgi:hypothetical protein
VISLKASAFGRRLRRRNVVNSICNSSNNSIGSKGGFGKSRATFGRW